MKVTVEKLAEDEGNEIEVNCVIEEEDHLVVYLTKYNGVPLEQELAVSSSPFLGNMFDMGADGEDIDIDKELLDMDEDDLELEEFLGRMIP